MEKLKQEVYFNFIKWIEKIAEPIGNENSIYLKIRTNDLDIVKDRNNVIQEQIYDEKTKRIKVTGFYIKEIYVQNNWTCKNNIYKGEDKLSVLNNLLKEENFKIFNNNKDSFKSFLINILKNIEDSVEETNQTESNSTIYQAYHKIIFPGIKEEREKSVKDLIDLSSQMSNWLDVFSEGVRDSVQEIEINRFSQNINKQINALKFHKSNNIDLKEFESFFKTSLKENKLFKISFPLENLVYLIDFQNNEGEFWFLYNCYCKNNQWFLNANDKIEINFFKLIELLKISKQWHDIECYVCYDDGTRSDYKYKIEMKKLPNISSDLKAIYCYVNDYLDLNLEGALKSFFKLLFEKKLWIIEFNNLLNRLIEENKDLINSWKDLREIKNRESWYPNKKNTPSVSGKRNDIINYIKLDKRDGWHLNNPGWFFKNKELPILLHENGDYIKWVEFTDISALKAWWQLLGLLTGFSNNWNLAEKMRYQLWDTSNNRWSFDIKEVSWKDVKSYIVGATKRTLSPDYTEHPNFYN